MDNYESLTLLTLLKAASDVDRISIAMNSVIAQCGVIGVDCVTWHSGNMARGGIKIGVWDHSKLQRSSHNQLPLSRERI